MRHVLKVGRRKLQEAGLQHMQQRTWPGLGLVSASTWGGAP
jgi:hypothetical protein